MRRLFSAWLVLALAAFYVRWAEVALAFRTLSPPADFDLRYFRFVAQFGLQHGWQQVYEPAVLTRAAGAALGPSYAIPMLDPPVALPLLAGLAQVGWPAAGYLWLALSALGFGAAAYLVATGAPLSRRLALVAATFGFAPVFIALLLGQLSVIAVLGVALGYFLARSDRPVAAGVALTLTLFKPQVAFLLPLGLLVTGRWRLLISWAAASAVAILLVVIVFGPPAMLAWIASLPGHVGAHWAGPRTWVFYLPSAALPVVLAACAAAVAFIARSHQRSSGSLEVVFGAGIAGSLLASPFTNPQDFSVLILAGWLMWRAYPHLVVGLGLVAAYLAVTIALLFNPSPTPFVELMAILLLAAAGVIRLRTSPAAAGLPAETPA